MSVDLTDRRYGHLIRAAEQTAAAWWLAARVRRRALPEPTLASRRSGVYPASPFRRRAAVASIHADCGRSSVGRASASQAEGREFEPRRPLRCCRPESRSEQVTCADFRWWSQSTQVQESPYLRPEAGPQLAHKASDFVTPRLYARALGPRMVGQVPRPSAQLEATGRPLVLASSSRDRDSSAVRAVGRLVQPHSARRTHGLPRASAEQRRASSNQAALCISGRRSASTRSYARCCSE
jgi:hypothetical protein